MEESISMKKTKVMLLGYSTDLKGGVVNVTKVLLDNIPQIQLVPFVNSYHSTLREVMGYVRALFILLLNIHKLRCLHVILGSKGDVLRSVIPTFVAKLFKVEVILHFHKSYGIIAQPPSSFISTIYRRCLDYIISYGTRVFLSESLQREFLEVSKNETLENPSSLSIPNALDSDWFVQDIRNFNERNIDVLFVGRWSAEKGIDDFIALCHKLPHVSFTAISNAPDNVTLDNLTLLNWGDIEQVRELMSSSKLLILPSYAEAYPTVLIEGLSQGTPFVASSLVGIKGISENSKAGASIETGDTDGYAKEIERYLNDTALWQELSLAGVQWVKDTHGTSNVIAKWQQLYAD